jgi:RNA polymerase sigma-70 factor (ECF subfamily)
MQRTELEILVRTHQAEVYRYLKYLGADSAAAEDLAQETFLAAFRSRAGVDLADAATAPAWLRGIARNMFLRHCRSRSRDPVRVDSQYLEQAEAFWAERFLQPADGFDYLNALRECLTTLSEPHREALRLRYQQRRSRAEMARALTLTEDGVKSLLRRIRASLAACIHGRLESEEAV